MPDEKSYGKGSCSYKRRSKIYGMREDFCKSPYPCEHKDTSVYGMMCWEWLHRSKARRKKREKLAGEGEV